MNELYAVSDDDEEDYFHSLDALLSKHETLKSVLVGVSNSAKDLPTQHPAPQPNRASAGRLSSLPDDVEEFGSDDTFRDEHSDDEEEDASISEPESIPPSEDMEAAEAAARRVLVAEADVDRVWPATAAPGTPGKTHLYS